MSPSSDTASYDGQLRSQWSNPSDILSLLLLVGGDVVQKALAQTAGRGFIPVAFSFGWVSYAFLGLLSAVGDKRIMPDPDCAVLVINTENGYSRSNRSWIIGRLMRDIDYWMDKRLRNQLQDIMSQAQTDEDDRVAIADAQGRPQKVPKKGLCISIYQGEANGERVCKRERVISANSRLIPLLQLGIAAVPCGLHKQWDILLVTALGLVLAILTSLLPQWQEEKWACRRLYGNHVGKNIAITRGNGAQHLIIILGAEGVYDLEDLTANEAVPDKVTVAWFSVAVLLWTALLITVSGIKSNTWYLLGVGALGMVQNTLLAGLARSPESYGLYLTYRNGIAHGKVMGALMKADVLLQRLGKPNTIEPLREVFFPGKLRITETAWWNLPIEQKDELLKRGFSEEKRQGQQRLLDDLGK